MDLTLVVDGSVKEDHMTIKLIDLAPNTTYRRYQSPPLSDIYVARIVTLKFWVCEGNSSNKSTT